MAIESMREINAVANQVHFNGPKSETSVCLTTGRFKSAPYVMLPKPFLFVLFFGVVAGLPSGYGQTNPSQVFSDPDEMRLLKETSITQAANQALSSTERAFLCRKGRGFITFGCQVDGTGHIESITSVRLSFAAKEVPAPLLAKLKKQVRRDVLFHVPTVDRPPNMGKWRRPTVTIPLAVFCK